MNIKMYEFPTPFESERLILRSYHPGDGRWFYAMSVKNKEHLSRFDTDNVAANVESEESSRRVGG